jgi:uncharacterized protein
VVLLSPSNPEHELPGWAGQLVLSHLKVAYAPAQRVLLVADVHLGKAATFRTLGVPVPAGTTQGNLDRLSRAIAHFKPSAVCFLGDLLHAKAAHNPELLGKLHEWRAEHAQVHMTLVRGNHDSKAGDPPGSLNVAVVEEPFMLGAFALCHHPRPVPGAFAVAGHEHPAVVLKGKAKARVRLPCFHLKQAQLILPSFGEFTGGFTIEPQSGEAVFPVCA